MELSKDIAKIAAEWWADKVYRMPHHDNGDRGSAGAIAGIMADMFSEPVSLEAKDRFVEELTNSLMERAKAFDSRVTNIGLSCDYGPDKMLYDAAKKSGVNPSNFPWKTCMHVRSDEVAVKNGYGAPWVTIYKAM